ncbi:hypothetical protein F5Y18DRAFT_381836 [Xylariaceae sp. FL1019]|nr:hypothetical protein F5Y18DRAFT_381836 [Xylariaceae sp. FL1019]
MSKWTPENDHQLLTAVLHHGELRDRSSEHPLGIVGNWAAVCKALVTQGLHRSFDGIRARWYKLRSDLEAKLPQSNIGPEATAPQVLSIVSGIDIASSNDV